MKLTLKLTRKEKDLLRIAAFSLLVIGILIETIAFADPALFNGTNYDTSMSTTFSTLNGWLNLNATKSSNVGDNLNGSVTLQNYPNNFQYGNTPIVYVLTPEEYSTWASTYPIGTPKTAIPQQTHFVYDFVNHTGWVLLSFKAQSSTFYKFVMSNPGGYSYGYGYGAIAAKLSLSVSSDSLRWWIHPLGIAFGIPAGLYVLPTRRRSK